MCGAIIKATKSYFQRGMTFCISIYMKKVMKLLAFIFEQPSYISNFKGVHIYINWFMKTNNCTKKIR